MKFVCWCVCRWSGAFAAAEVRLPLGWCICRWVGAFAAGLVRLPLDWCVCRWVGAFAAGLVRLPLGRLADVRIDFQLFFIGLSWLSLRFHTFSCELCMFV